MKRSYSIILVLLVVVMTSCGRGRNSIPKVSSGTIVRLSEINSKLVAPRNIDVWLPDGYSKNEKYPVIYFNDGQMLFDSTVTWNHQELNVDEVVTDLVRKGKIRKCIVVAIASRPELRQNEYLPEITIERLNEPFRSSLLHSELSDKPLSDKYLKFIVTELKPVVDSAFSTQKDYKGTYIAGSGLGGLMAVYALCKYPEVFGGAASMSTHWPVIGPGLYTEKMIESTSMIFRNFMSEHLPFMHGRKIYYDHGTEGLDGTYGRYQNMVDQLMIKEGFTPEEWITKVFPGESGEESSISDRLSYPFEFLLGVDHK